MKTITVYTQTTCAYCKQVKQFLNIKKQEFSEVNLDEHPEVRDEIVAKTGARTVPVVMSVDEDGNEKFAVGWNPAQLMAVIK